MLIAVDVQFTVEKEGPLELLQQCCQPCGFPANLGLFLWICGFFEDLRVACFGAFLIKIGLLLRIFVCGLLKFYGTFAVSIYCKTKFGVFLCKFAHLGLFFRICLPTFIFNLPAGFMFFEFSYKTQVGLVFFH